ncbi:hypothetical protein CC80DRAFT_564409 [Byssothecium circinans]|uniref:Uncharacterized protein n=1 Tax=Byssothecium circinans TaxID=147558 RepID=A0A6A5TY58_9PLEO|nr:hypothetical protein CC80DRAFT_564409 [Byssothecium circinans]
MGLFLSKIPLYVPGHFAFHAMYDNSPAASASFRSSPLVKPEVCTSEPPSLTHCDNVTTQKREKTEGEVKALLRDRGTKQKDVRRVVALWNFDKDYTEQEVSTIDCGECLLLRHMKGQQWYNEAARAFEVYNALTFYIERILTQCGCRTIEYGPGGLTAYSDVPGAPKPTIPRWLDIPFINIEEGRDAWGDFISNIAAEQQSVRNARADSAQRPLDAPQDG